jgi:MinD superfamily P-loop ATPase
MDCTAVCPADNALELKTKGSGKYVWNTAKVSIVIVGLFAGLVFTARMTGHWQSSVTEQEFRLRLQTIDSPKVSHPAVRFR